MKICLEKKSAFTFRGVKSYELDLNGITVYEMMRERLGAEEDDGRGDRIVLAPVYPFLTREELLTFADEREGSYFFTGGAVIRDGAEPSGAFRSRTSALGQGLFEIRDYAAVLMRAERESAALHMSHGALVEEGAVVSFTSLLSEGAVIGRGARVLGRCVIGANAEIGGGSELIDSMVGENTVVRASVLERARVGANCTVGPNAFLRQGTQVGDECRIGDFVELKNARVGNGTKIAHLAYVGDAVLGRKVNVGCGAVFVNYNGKEKAETVVGDKCFIGSNCNLIAPLTIRDGAFLAAGTTLTQNLSENDFCIGRSRETVKPHRGKQYYDPK